ncbi:hypothetical protein [Streptomyces sp. NRRL F-5630]|uniref:hypothetical protein n=1 Tax=Streptomyces sp. NRRL F-5630 TaxID=1463864 RepID=UPI0004C85349|nr:hypothetical protein [Streptomyces sp. NRRL F-5630]
MSTQENAAEDPVRRAVSALVTVFENLGAEHQALKAEEAETTALERRGTVSRMGEGIAATARMVSLAVGTLATLHGLRALGVDQQYAKDVEGGHYSPLLSLDSSTETLHDAFEYLDDAVRALERAYAPTRKYPRLAVARRPGHMRTVLSGLRAALDAACADLAAHDPEAAEDYARAGTVLTELEKRVCAATVPAQSGPSAEEVVAAIRSRPEVARAAAAALKTGT